MGSESDSVQAKKTIALLLIIIILAAAQLLSLVFTAAGLNSDAYQYIAVTHRMAEDGILEGLRGDYFWPHYPVHARLAMYPLISSFLYRIIGDTVLSLRLVSALSGIALIPIGYLIVMELFKNAPLAIMSAALIGFLPKFTKTSVSIYRESLMALLLGVAFLFLLWAMRQKKPWPLWSVLVGLLTFAAFLTRPDGGAAAVAFGIILILLAPKALKMKRRLVICLLMAVTFIVLQAPYMIWMKRETGYWMFNQWQIHHHMSQSESAWRHFSEIYEEVDPDAR